MQSQPSSPSHPDHADQPSSINTGPLWISVELRLGPGPIDPNTAHVIRLLQELSEAEQQAKIPTPTTAPSLWMVPAARTVFRQTTEIRLTRREYDLLLHLAEQPRRVFTRAQLLQQVWDDPYTSHRTIDVHVRRLRSKIGVDLPVVSTLRGVGYRLHSDMSVKIIREPEPNSSWDGRPDLGTS
ncbi:winged helix-turn-helix domain-containing protein [Micromonospora pisi]|uniref:winged helix-turn-helix domain-containing protein n=1 Tax=Micromonospora pisi TaxID=589240 RepID=UPI001FE3B116|nr:winged helix-turn-helix domain-containing protein [Micromonospora pisi]